jgi:hypothetical protein
MLISAWPECNISCYMSAYAPESAYDGPPYPLLRPLFCLAIWYAVDKRALQLRPIPNQTHNRPQKTRRKRQIWEKVIISSSPSLRLNQM